MRKDKLFTIHVSTRYYGSHKKFLREYSIIHVCIQYIHMYVICIPFFFQQMINLHASTESIVQSAISEHLLFFHSFRDAFPHSPVYRVTCPLRHFAAHLFTLTSRVTKLVQRIIRRFPAQFAAKQNAFQRKRHVPTSAYLL